MAGRGDIKKEAAEADKGGERLQKLISRAGMASRRAAEEFILKGRVSVNGRVVTELGSRADPQRDEIRVDGRLLEFSQTRVVLLLNKPKGCVTTLRDPQGRPTVKDLFPSTEERLFPVGRLDYDAEGLLLLTNDGLLANGLQHPRYGVTKTYEVKVKGHPGEETLRRLRNGVVLDEGRTAPAEVEVIRLLPHAAWMRIVLHQGWNRQIKRMGESVGHSVLKIRRVAYGPLTLGKLQPGESRRLKPNEIEELERIAGVSRGKSEAPERAGAAGPFRKTQDLLKGREKSRRK